MANSSSSLIIIDEKGLRGVLAPPSLFSKELLEDVIDLIELSSPEIAKDTEERIKEANRGKSWLSLERVKRLAEKAK